MKILKQGFLFLHTIVSGVMLCCDLPVHWMGLGPVVQSVVSLTTSLRVISLTVLADSIYNTCILIFFAEKM